jgi:DNA-directed RNA polymerase subunit RPC12/RpoP
MVTVVGKSGEFVRSCTCKNCSSKLEYTKSEVETYKHTDYSGSTDTYHYINCPNCRQKVYVKGY